MLRNSEYLPRKGVAVINSPDKLFLQLLVRKTPKQITKFLKGKKGKLRVIIVGEIEKTGAVVFRGGDKNLSLMSHFFDEIKWS